MSSVIPTRYKKTTPFAKECSFYVPDDDGLLEGCLTEATIGFYFTASNNLIGMLSVCPYHAIVQESLFVAGKE